MYSKELYEALTHFDEGVFSGEKFSLSSKENQPSGDKHRLPHASALGLCPTKARYERDDLEPTHLYLTVENQIPHKLALGHIAQAWVYEALYWTIHGADLQSELPVRTAEFSGRIDILINPPGGISTIIEVKSSESERLSSHWKFQIVSYLRAMPTAEAFLVIWTPQKWIVYSVEPEGEDYGFWKYLPDIQDSELTEVLEGSAWEWEVLAHRTHLESAAPIRNIKSPLDHWQCGKMTAKPHRYKAASKDGDYQKGDIKLGQFAPSCSFFGLCHHNSIGAAYSYEVTVDENDNPVILSTEEEVPF